MIMNILSTINIITLQYFFYLMLKALERHSILSFDNKKLFLKLFLRSNFTIWTTFYTFDWIYFIRYLKYQPMIKSQPYSEPLWNLSLLFFRWREAVGLILNLWRLQIQKQLLSLSEMRSKTVTVVTRNKKHK